jgi:hypothetical protein
VQQPHRLRWTQQQITDLSGDLITRPFVRVVPLKGARDSFEGRLYRS